MMQIGLIGIGAGAAAALLFASVTTGSWLAVGLFYLAPLPIMIAGLGWSHWSALIAALKSGHIRHAGLDVFHSEPLPADHPLTLLPNVTLTAHADFRTLEASMTLLRRAIDIVRTLV